MSSVIAEPVVSIRTAGRVNTAVHVGLGLFLLITAGLKLHGLWLDPLAAESFLSSPRLQIAAIEVEVVLGLSLIAAFRFAASRRRAVAWTTTAFFTLLSLISLYQAIDGQGSCGCFGQLQVSPWATFALDAGIVALLVSTTRRARSVSEEDESVESVAHPSGSDWLSAFLKTVLGAAVFLAIIAGSFFLLFDNPVAALAQLRGESITVEPVVSDVGTGRPGESREFQVNLTNHTDREVRVLGGTTKCACIATDGLPLALPAHKSEALAVRIKFTGSPGRFQHRFVLYTDDQKQPIVTARFTGRVAGASP